MHVLRLDSWLLVPCAAAILTVGCGQGNRLLSPTAPTGTLGSTALTMDRTAEVPATEATADVVTALDRDGKGKRSDSSDSEAGDHERRRDNRDTAPGGSGRGNHGELSGFVTAVSEDSLTVRGITVRVEPTTVIRHGRRILTLAAIRVGDHVQVRGIRRATTLVATEIKVEHTGRGHDDEDDDEDDEEDLSEVKGTVSGLTGTCPALTFTVGTTGVTTTDRTVFEDVTCATLANGAVVEVEGMRQADGSIVAASVELDEPTSPAP